MTAVFSRFADKLISLEALIVFIAIGLLGLWRRPTCRGVRVWLTGVVAVYTLISIPLVSYFAVQLFGHRYEPFVAAERVEAVVVLGAGSGTLLGVEQRLGLLSDVGASRVLEAARVYRALGSPWVISSGGTTQPLGETSAETMQRALVHLGVPADRILLETESTNTHQEAVLLAPILRRLHAERFALVTTRSHMPRSEAVFRAQGLTPIAAVVPDRLPRAQWPLYLSPNIDGLQRSGLLFHEIVGLVYYRLRGWI